MKKTAAMLLVFLMMMGCALTSQAGFRYGPRLGVNVNKLHFNKDVLDGANRCGFVGGLTAEYLIPAINFGFDISLMYSYMDYDVNVETKLGSAEASPKFGKHFLEIPLNLKYMITIPAVASVIRPYIFTGPAVAFRLDKDDKNFKSKTAQWTWNLGIGLELIKRLQIGASYGWGMNNIMDKVEISDKLGFTPGDLKMRTNYWTVTAAWMF